MGRPKHYQVATVVELALQAFWKAGFEGTSVKDLEVATGLNKFSLYASFGSKRGLFLACLDHYVERYLGPYFATLEPTAERGLEAFLGGLVENLAQAGALGCILLNAGIEFHGQDADLNARVARVYGVVTTTMEEYWHDKARAEAFTTFVRGLMAAARMGVDRAALEAAVAGSRPLWEPVHPIRA